MLSDITPSSALTAEIEQAIAVYIAADLDVWQPGEPRAMPPTKGEVFIRLAEVEQKVACLTAILPETGSAPLVHQRLQSLLQGIISLAEAEEAWYRKALVGENDV